MFAGTCARGTVRSAGHRYSPGATIGWHRDAPGFDVVVGISLGAACRFRFRRGETRAWETMELLLQPRSIYVLDGAARSEWQHSIPAVKALRYSITFRSMKAGNDRRQKDRVTLPSRREQEKTANAFGEHGRDQAAGSRRGMPREGNRRRIPGWTSTPSRSSSSSTSSSSDASPARAAPPTTRRRRAAARSRGTRGERRRSVASLVRTRCEDAIPHDRAVRQQPRGADLDRRGDRQIGVADQLEPLQRLATRASGPSTAIHPSFTCGSPTDFDSPPSRNVKRRGRRTETRDWRGAARADSRRTLRRRSAPHRRSAHRSRQCGELRRRQHRSRRVVRADREHGAHPVVPPFVKRIEIDRPSAVILQPVRERRTPSSAVR